MLYSALVDDDCGAISDAISPWYHRWNQNIVGVFLKSERINVGKDVVLEVRFQLLINTDEFVNL